MEAVSLLHHVKLINVNVRALTMVQKNRESRVGRSGGLKQACGKIAVAAW
jgi:hypothetical protein